MKKVCYLGIALAACLSSCSDDSLDNGKTVVNPVQTGDEIIFGSSLSDNANMIESRTVYGDRTETGVPVYWEDDGSDTIAIFCNQASQPANHLVHYKVMPETEDLNKDGKPDKHQAHSVTKVNTAEAGLQWGAPDTEHRFYAFYPASAVKGSTEENETGMITANIPVTQQVQEWRTGTFSSKDGDFDGKTCHFGLPNMDYAYMYAYQAVTPSEVSKDEAIDLNFKNLVTVLDITVQGPKSGTATITNINVDAIDGEQPILTGDFTCNIRNASTGATATCTPVGSFNEERGRISIPCYDKKTGRFIQLGPEELLNVKAYIIPQNIGNTVTRRTLRVTVSMLNGAPCRKTLNTADVTPQKINRVILPKLEVGGTNYWMSSLDPDIYVSELSIPGSKFSILSEANNAANIYQNASIEQQFQDGVRAFIFQTAAKGSNSDGGLTPENNTFTGDIKVVSEEAKKEVMSLEAAVKEIASYLEQCQQIGKENEFAFLMLTYATGGDSDAGTGYYAHSFMGVPYDWTWIREPRNADQTWINLLRDKVNELAEDPNNRIYTDEITPNTTIDDVKGTIILKANYNTQDMLKYYTDPKSFVYNGPDVKTSAPIMFTFWGASTGPNGSGDWTYQDNNGGMPMDWGTPVWYANSTAQLRWYYQEVTSVGTNQEATRDQKEAGITKLFQESVKLYKNDTSHKTWFMNDLGGYYSDRGDINGRGTGIEALAIDMNQMGVDELQDRTENAGLGLVFMNFADKLSDSGAKYKSDWLIQTLIDNNFKFALRKKGSTTTTTSYNASYKTGVNAIGWDK